MSRDRTCAIHQPNFLPRLSTIAKIYRCSRWVVLDNVQFVRRDYQHRCRLATSALAAGERWLTLPVHLPRGRATTIDEVVLVDPLAASTRVRRILADEFRRTTHSSALEAIVDSIDGELQNSRTLLDVAEASTLAILSLLGWQGEHVRSSAFSVRNGRSDRLADLTIASGTSTYVCGTGGSKYLDELPFKELGVTVEHFALPDGPDQPWQGARRISSLHPLLALGPDQLRRRLDTVCR